MYKAIIVTIYNVIELDIEDIYNEEFLEVLSQPYIKDVLITKIDNLSLKKK